MKIPRGSERLKLLATSRLCLAWFFSCFFFDNQSKNGKSTVEPAIYDQPLVQKKAAEKNDQVVFQHRFALGNSRTYLLGILVLGYKTRMGFFPTFDPKL